MTFLHIGFLFVLSGYSLFADVPRDIVEKKYALKQDGSEFIQVQGMRVHVRDQGPRQAQALVLMHGIADSLHTWDHWANQLKHDYRVIRFDVPGFGLTDGVTEKEFTPEFYNQFLKDFLSELDVKQPILIGNSLGGFLAWNYALFARDDVKALILLDPAAYPLTPPWIVRIASTPFRSIAENFSPKMITKMVAKEVFANNDLVTDEVVDRYHAMLTLEDARPRYMDVFASINRFADQRPMGIETLSLPIQLLWGKKDRWITVDQIDLWKKDVPHVQVRIYDHVGHVPQEEAPVESLNDARLFLESL